MRADLPLQGRVNRDIDEPSPIPFPSPQHKRHFRENVHVLRTGHRPGHDLLARHRVSRRPLHRRRRRSRNFRSIFRHPAGSSTTRRTSGPRPCCDLPRGAAEGRPRPPRTSPPSASPTSARPPWSGTAPPARPIHNAIVWQDRRTADICAQLKSEGHEPLIAAQNRPAARPLFLRHQDRLDARQRARRARRAPSAASSPSAPSIASCCGG